MSQNSTEQESVLSQVLHLNELILSGDIESARTFVRDRCITPKTYECLSVYEREAISPVEICAKAGQAELLALFLDLGFSPKGWSKSPIIMACRRGHVEVVKLLVENGVDPMEIWQTFIRRVSPLYCAIQCKQLRVVELLFEKGISLEHGHIIYPLSHAASVGAEDICRYLLFKGVDVEDNTDGDTPLVSSIISHQKNICRVLLEAGASPHNRGQKGQPPFLSVLSSMYMHPYVPAEEVIEILDLLLSFGADPSARCRMGTYAFHYSIWSYEISRYLVHLNVSLTVRQPHRDHTPFVLAMEAGKYSTAALLVQAGYTPSADELALVSRQEAKDPDEHKNITARFMLFISSPRALIDICTHFIRQLTGTQIEKYLESLSLPKSLKAYLMLEHIPETPTEEFPPMGNIPRLSPSVGTRQTAPSARPLRPAHPARPLQKQY